MMEKENIVIVIIVVLVALVMLYTTSAKKHREEFRSNDDILDFLNRMIKNQNKLNEYEVKEANQTRKINEIKNSIDGIVSWLN